MAKQEKDREDLMAEARNLVERCELRVPSETLPVVAGFHRDGRLSIYFGPDPVYHFDTAGRIRRAFASDLLYKAEGGRLVQLTRTRTAEAILLKRHEMSEAETSRWLAEATRRLQGLGEALESGRGQVLRQVPAESDPIRRLCGFLQGVLKGPLSLAPSARSL